MKSATVSAIAGSLIMLGAAAAFCLVNDVDSGREVYAVQKCALCHSIAGIGGKKMPLDRVGTKLKRDEMKKWIQAPKSMKADTMMKSYPNLPEKDLDDLTAFLLSLK
jgi:cytochrome c2